MNATARLDLQVKPQPNTLYLSPEGDCFLTFGSVIEENNLELKKILALNSHQQVFEFLAMLERQPNSSIQIFHLDYIERYKYGHFRKEHCGTGYSAHKDTVTELKNFVLERKMLYLINFSAGYIYQTRSYFNPAWIVTLIGYYIVACKDWLATTSLNRWLLIQPSAFCCEFDAGANAVKQGKFKLFKDAFEKTPYPMQTRREVELVQSQI